jgi:hypothetical protein
MPNPIQRMLRQASESVPGQRPIRLPWQEPTPGERAAEKLDALADSTVVAEDQLNRFNDRTTQRAQVAKRAGAGAIGNVRDRLQRNLGYTQSTAQDQINTLHERAADQAEDLRSTTRDRARLFKRHASERASDVAETATHARRTLSDQANAIWQEGDDEGGLHQAGARYVAGDADASVAAARAAQSAMRAEVASRRAVGAASQMAGALNRILQARGNGELRAVVEEETPTDVEIRVGEAAESPLMRAADAVARVLAAAGGTIYDYSGGHYGIEPVSADELRKERKREKRNARPVAIIEGHYAGDKAAEVETKGRSRTPLLIAGLAFGLAAVGVAYTQRSRLLPLLDQVMAQVQGQRTSVAPRTSPRITAGPPTPTPSFNRVTSGQLIQSGSPAATVAPATSTRSAPAAPSAPSTTPTVASSDGTERTYVAGEPTGTQTQP